MTLCNNYRNSSLTFTNLLLCENMKDQLLDNRVILLGIPLMILIVVVERFVAFLKKKDLGHYQESLANIQCGLGQLILELPVKGVLVYGYLFILNNLSILQLDKSVTSFCFSFIVTDFLHYWYHRSHHTIPLLWRIHSVHHQPEHFNYTVGLRLPWLHKLTVFPFYFLQALIGFPVEVFLVTVSIHAILQLWNHTEMIEGKWGVLNKLIVTPSQHRVHHGKNKIYLDRNFAAIFSIWDVLFGTFTLETEKVKYGIEGGIDPCKVIESNLGPFVKIKSSSKFKESLPKKNLNNLNLTLSLILGTYTLWLGTKINPIQLIPLILLSIALMSQRFSPAKILLFPLLFLLIKVSST